MSWPRVPQSHRTNVREAPLKQAYPSNEQQRSEYFHILRIGLVTCPRGLPLYVSLVIVMRRSSAGDNLLTCCYVSSLDGSPNLKCQKCFFRCLYAWFNTYHFSIKFPRTQRTISEYSHSMSTEGSYPRVALPSASVVPLTSTTWISASACRKSSKNLFPSPRPWCAPGTSPATSSNSIGTDRRPSWQPP